VSHEQAGSIVQHVIGPDASAAAGAERGMTRRWVLPAPVDPMAVAGSAGLPPLVRRVFAARGFASEEALREFAHPTLRQLHDPSLMAGLDDAAGRLLDAARAGRRIVIYGDYDVDGVCATAILYHMLKTLCPAAAVDTYVPHRIEEGYGLNAAALRELAQRGTSVVVSVDCGVSALRAAEVAQDAGLELIITDHHNIQHDDDGQPMLPDAAAIVHPRLAGPGGAPYPCGELCGAGVAFKLAWRMATMHTGSDRVAPEIRELLLDLLALAGLATIADIVPLLDENRVIARFGLQRIQHTRLVGLDALLKVSKLVGANVGAIEAGFRLGPRLNACGRLGHAREAVELFTTDDPARAMAIARAFDELNAERRAMEARIFERACSMAEDAGMADEHRAIVLADPEWHPGVVGIVCSRLVERYGRPALLMQRGEELCKGSGRSVDGFNLHAGLTACSEHLTTYGGHNMAAGLSLANARLEAFTEAFLAHAATRITDEMLTPSLRIDAQASLDELNMATARALESMGPYGRANETPVILVRCVRLTGNAEPLGASGAHIRFQIGPEAGAPGIAVKGWNWGEHVRSLRRGMRVDVALKLEVNTFRGLASAEGVLCDLAIRD
jgi:single-stranded-DNA-specific exonuclease